MTTILYVLSAILLLGILVTIHEFGHFIFARICGIAVDEFAIGFGPKIVGWTSKKHGTRFSLRVLPLGGFCAFIGEDDAEGKHVDDPRAYARQPVWKRMLSVIMGPGMNFVLAFVVMLLFFWIGGTTAYEPYVQAVDAGAPAQVCGMQVGDKILRVDETDVSDGSIDAVSAAIAAHGTDAPMQFVLLRDEQKITLDVPPFFDEEEQRYRVGIILSLRPVMEKAPDGTLRYVKEAVSFGDAAELSWASCVYAGGAILGALKTMVTTGEGIEQTAGPVGVVSIVSQQVREGGFAAFLNLLVVISINLGIMNLLPIPGLDGSRFLFMLLEAVRGKPIPQRKEAMVHLVGMALLLALMIVLTFRDVLNLFH